jgi:hypothetical protein
VFCFCAEDDRSLEVRCVPRNLNIDSRKVSDQSRGPMLLSIYKKVNPDPDSHGFFWVGWRAKKNKKKFKKVKKFHVLKSWIFFFGGWRQLRRPLLRPRVKKLNFFI